MLQQTTVRAVIPYYKRWIGEFPTIASVARAPLQRILKVWQGLGYYSRAKNIHRSAQILCEQHDGQIPAQRQHLLKLPGFGPYTAGAVLSIAFDQREPIIDANIRRVMMRQLGIKGPSLPAHDPKIRSFLLRIMPRKRLSAFNQALMELGALVCRSQSPQCLSCPVKRSCKAYAAGLQEVIPEPRKMSIRSVDVAISVIKHNGKFLIQKRGPKGLFADLWEFPGGKIEKGESARSAMIREVLEEVGIDVQPHLRLPSFTHYFTQFKARLHVWICSLNQLPAKSVGRKWVSLSQLSHYPMPAGSARIVDYLQESKKLDKS